MRLKQEIKSLRDENVSIHADVDSWSIKWKMQPASKAQGLSTFQEKFCNSNHDEPLPKSTNSNMNLRQVCSFVLFLLLICFVLIFFFVSETSC